jgi:hypothetical protein
VLTINSSTPNQIVEGVFNLDSRAFIAHVQLGGTIVTMFSLGPDGDAQYRDLLAQLAAQDASQGVDLMSLLATKVQLRTVNGGGQATVTAVSLLQGLQIYSENPKKGPAGLSIIAPITATVGLFAHSYSFNAVPNPTGVAGTTKGCSTAETATVLNPSPCTTPGPYKPKSGYRRHTGFRSSLTRIEITGIGGKTKTETTAKKKEDEAVQAPTEQPEPEAPKGLPKDYAEMTVAQVSEGAKSWNRPMLEAAQIYEQEHAQRKGALAALESALKAKDENDGA